MTLEQIVSIVKDAGFSVLLLYVFIRSQDGNNSFNSKLLDLFGQLTSAVNALKLGVDALKDVTDKRNDLTEKESAMLLDMQTAIEDLTEQVGELRKQNAKG